MSAPEPLPAVACADMLARGDCEHSACHNYCLRCVTVIPREAGAALCGPCQRLVEDPADIDALRLSNASRLTTWPEVSVEELAAAASEWAGQYQQRPVPLEAAMTPSGFAPPRRSYGGGQLLVPVEFERIEPEAVPVEVRFENVVHARVGGIAYRYPGAMSYAAGILDDDEEAFVGSQVPGASPAQRHPWASMSRPRVKVRFGESVLSRQVVGCLAQEYATDEMVYGPRARELHRATARDPESVRSGGPYFVTLANRHRARRWAREFAQVCAVAGDALLQGDRGVAVNVLCSVVRLEDALELTTVAGRARLHRRRFEWARRGLDRARLALPDECV